MSALWTILAPIFTSRSHRVVSGQCFTSSDNARVRRKLARLKASACSWQRIALAAKRRQDARFRVTVIFSSLMYQPGTYFSVTDGTQARDVFVTQIRYLIQLR